MSQTLQEGESIGMVLEVKPPKVFQAALVSSTHCRVGTTLQPGTAEAAQVFPSLGCSQHLPLFGLF